MAVMCTYMYIGLHTCTYVLHEYTQQIVVYVRIAIRVPHLTQIIDNREGGGLETRVQIYYGDIRHMFVTACPLCSLV